MSKKQADQLNRILKRCPEFRILYMLKEEFRTILEKVICRDKATRFLDTWCLKAKCTCNKHFLKFLTTFRNWQSQNLNKFFERITNAIGSSRESIIPWGQSYGWHLATGISASSNYDRLQASVIFH